MNFVNSHCFLRRVCSFRRDLTANTDTSPSNEIVFYFDGRASLLGSRLTWLFAHSQMAEWSVEILRVILTRNF